jgi:hypothetical protein
VPLPATATPAFRSLLETYRRSTIANPQLRVATAAQWALESGWGTSALARNHLNFAGMKWRQYMQHWATPTSYTAHDGRTVYCHFDTHAAYIAGYWGRLDVEPAYRGWREHVETPETFMSFIGPIWLGTGKDEGARYVRDVLRISAQIADVFKEAPDEVARDDPAGGDSRPWHRMRPDAEAKPGRPGSAAKEGGQKD